MSSSDSLFSFEDLLEDYVDSKDEIQIDDDADLTKDDMLNIVEFAESPRGLNFKLRPMQRVILKLLYGLPLDDFIPPEVVLSEQDIKSFIKKGEMVDENSPVPLVATEQIRFRHPISGIETGPLTEKELLDYLRKNNRTNGVECRTSKTGAVGYGSLVLSIGRRGGKSTMSTIISCYEIYRLLRMGCPQDHYKLRKSAIITVILVGTDKNQSEMLFNDVVSYAVKSPYLSKYLATSLKGEIEFATPYDLSRASAKRKVRPTLQIKPVSCNAAAIRGGSAIQGIMDEVAHMRSSNSKRASAEEVYKALKPALSTFHDSKMIMISSPNGSTGFFYDYFSKELSRVDGNVLCIQAPTWEVNPGRVKDDELLLDYNVNKNSFYQEWEAKFEASVRAYIEQINLFERVLYPVTNESFKMGELPERGLLFCGLRGEQYYMSIDQGFKNDGTVISIGHYDVNRDKIVVDFVQKFAPGDPEVSLSNGRLSSSKIVHKIQGTSIKFNVLKGFFDQHEGSTLEEKFMEKGMHNFYKFNMSEAINSEIYKLFERLYSEERVEIPAIEWLVQEFRDLEVRSRGGVGENKRIKVEAGHGAHDDGPDSVVRLVYALYHEFVLEGNVVGDPATALLRDSGYKVVKSLRYNDRIVQNKIANTTNKYLSNKGSSSRFRSGVNPRSRR